MNDAAPARRLSTVSERAVQMNVARALASEEA